jgi:hypothetical protein
MRLIAVKFGLALAAFGLFGSVESASAGIIVNFSGTVTEFENTILVRTPGNAPVETPGITDIGPGSTFTGSVYWSYDPQAFSVFKEVYRPVPIIEFSVDNKYLFSSEMALSQLLPRQYYGVIVTDAAPAGESVDFFAGHGGLVDLIVADLNIIAPSSPPPFGPVEDHILHDISAFTSALFDFGYSVNNANPLLNRYDLSLQGTVTSLSARSTFPPITPSFPPIAAPEPSTIVSAAIAGLAGLGVAARRRGRVG